VFDFWTANISLNVELLSSLGHEGKLDILQRALAQHLLVYPGFIVFRLANSF
jgi:hypothetical protein